MRFVAWACLLVVVVDMRNGNGSGDELRSVPARSFDRKVLPNVSENIPMTLMINDHLEGTLGLLRSNSYLPGMSAICGAIFHSYLISYFGG